MPQLKQVASSGLLGWRQKVGDAVAAPVARRTRFNEDQVRAVVGGLFFVLAARYVVRAATTAIARARHG